MIFSKGVERDILARAAKLSSQARRIVLYADSDDEILKACSEVKKKAIARPVVIGDHDRIIKSFKRLRLKNLDEENVLDPKLETERMEAFIKEYIAMRKADGHDVTPEQAQEKLLRPHYFGAMMVHKDLASGMISGFNSATKPYYPVFEIVKLARGVTRTSGMMMMIPPSGKHLYFFSDCVMNIDPDPHMLAEIAALSARTCQGLGYQPRVAMLSFSTRNSAKHPMVEKVKEATRLAKHRLHGVIIDGEIQLDAAIVEHVAAKKCPDSPLEGKANVLIFPDLNAANIGYKLTERLAGYRAVGPILEGLRRPVNDLSRGCSIQDIVSVSAVTVIQASHGYDMEHEKPKKSRQASYKDLPSNVRKIIEESKKRGEHEDSGD